MNQIIKKRVVEEAQFIKKTKLTIREISKVFNVSKSTVHKDLRERLKLINYKLYIEVDSILNEHLITRHIKGGLSTQKKYKKVI